MFAHLNDDVLFGEVWNEKAIDLKTKCIVTVVFLMASGITDASLTYHLQNAKAHEVQWTTFVRPHWQPSSFCRSVAEGCIPIQ